MSPKNSESPESQMNFFAAVNGVVGKLVGNLIVNNYSNTPSESPKERDSAQQQLLRAVEIEVESRLTQSLHDRVYIVLDKEENTEQIQDPCEIDVKIGKKPSYPLQKNTPIKEVFYRQYISGQLLILGAPGAGKTTMLLELAKPLVQQAKAHPDNPIPVFFNLSSWKEDKQSIKDWMVTELEDKPRFKVDKDIAKQWIEEKKIIPLLDGLDELDAVRQEKCVEKINEFLHDEAWSRGLVVCSRLEEYQHYSTNLGLKASIILKPLTTEQIQNHVLKIEGKDLWNNINADSDLMELAQSPLFLNIIILSYQEISFDRWNEFKSLEQRKSYLFDAYIQRMFKRKYKEKLYKNDDVEFWLGWLSRQLIQENQTEFLIEKMQHTWLPKRQEEITYSLIFVIIMLIFWLIFGLISGLTTNLRIGLIFGLIFGLMVGVLDGVIDREIKTVETLQFSFKHIDRKLIVMLVGWLSGCIPELIKGVYSGTITFLFIWIITVITIGVKDSEFEYKNTPNEGIKQSIKNIIVLTSINFIPWCGVAYMTGKTEPSFNILYILVWGFGGSLLFGGINKSGLPVIKHFSLRLVLWFNRYIPWNYARFLDYSTDRLFLQRVGGGYRFIHDLLRQHFAEKY